MKVAIRKIDAKHRCANLLCSNAVGEGTMELLTFSPPEDPDPEVKKPVQLLLCGPCSGVLCRVIPDADIMNINA